MAGCNQGSFTRLAIDGQQMPFLRIIDRSRYGLVDTSDKEIRGILEPHANRVTAGIQVFRWVITMQPSPADLDVILPLIGMNESPTDTFSVVDGSGDSVSPQSFTSIIDRSTKVHTYSTCYVDKATFYGQRGDAPVNLDLEIVGTSESEGSSFSASAIGTPDLAFAFHEGTVKLGTAAGVGTNGIVEFDRFRLVINNHLASQYNNSATATAICPTRREITLAISTPYTSDEATLYSVPGPVNTSTAGYSSPDAYIKFTRTSPAVSTLFTFGNLKSIAKPPDIPGKEEVRLAQFYKAYTTDSAAALVVTHDATA